MIAAVEAFALCPTPGCCVRVWGSTRTENHCKAHGGNPLDLMEIPEDDEWGEPIHGEPGVPPARLLPNEDCE